MARKPKKNWDRSNEPRVEGTVRLADGRQLGFAEFGVHDGRAVFWLHGTPGARRQIPVEARRLGRELGFRIIGVDRPGIGASTPHLYRDVSEFAADLEEVADRLGVDEFVTVGLSGGGPYALGAAAKLTDRVPTVTVLGGVAPTVGPDAISGGLVALGKALSPIVRPARVPAGLLAAGAMRITRPAANQLIDVAARIFPEGDRALLGQPEFKTMFLDDLLTGSRRQFGAVFSDIVLFSRHWGFDAADVSAPVTWWHGDADTIIPISHGEHLASRLPGGVFRALPGVGHLGGLGIGEDIFTEIERVWN